MREFGVKQVCLVALAAALFSVVAGVEAQGPSSPPIKFESWNNPGLVALIRGGGAPPPNTGGPGRPTGPFPFAVPPLPTDLAGPDGPAPRRDLTGIWDPGFGGIGPFGARNPSPLTPWGEAKGRTHKSGDGIRMVPAAEINDPLSTRGDPGGYPRQLLFELRPVQFLQTPQSVVALFMWERRWRVIWTDGRPLPAEPDPRWYGYSIGRWEDDQTFVVTSNGTDERTWLDNAGNPHSNELRVEERWRVISRNRLELTVTIDDPKTYTRPWVAIDKMSLVRLPPSTDLMEMMNSATEATAVAEQYKREAEAAR